MMTNEDLQSRTIDFLRFPLIVGVVLIHSYFDDVPVMKGTQAMQLGELPVYSSVSYLLSQIFARVAVPLFFFISGFLFFYKTETFSWGVYKKKLKKRFRSLLIPYVFWNLVVILLLFLSQTLLSGLMSGRAKLVTSYTWSDWLWCFWDRQMVDSGDGDHFPVAYQLWFVRDLMVAVLCSPLIYFLIRKTKGYVLLLLGLLWYSDCWFSLPGFSIAAFFFFSAGACFSIYKKNFVAAFARFFPYSCYVYLVCAVCILLLRDCWWVDYLRNAGILVGMLCFVSLSSYGLQRKVLKNNALLSSSSFFVYVYHGMPMALAIKLLFKVLPPYTDARALLVYLGAALAVILLGIGIYVVLQKWFPRFTAFITGGRV